MKQMEEGYLPSVDSIDKTAWHELMLEFDDVAFYQTWSYGAVSWGEGNMSHLVLMYGQQPVAMAQARIVRLPFLKAGVAYVTSGPMWKRKGAPADLANLRNVLRALRNEYSERRGNLLQILPRTTYKDQAAVLETFKAEGFGWTPDPQQTMYVDLVPTLEDIRMNTRKQWRQTLARAEKQNLEILEESSDEACTEAEKLIEEMKNRKRFVEYGDMKAKIAVHRDLPEVLRLKFAISKKEGRPVSVLAWFPEGLTGLPLIAATGMDGLERNASYPLFWKMVRYYKDRGSFRCDLGGVNKERNPGGYVFKAGLAGKTSEIINYIGQFETSENAVSTACFRTGAFARSLYRNARVGLNRAAQTLRRAFSNGGRKRPRPEE